MKYLIIFTLSINILFGYANFSYTNNTTDTTPGINLNSLQLDFENMIENTNVKKSIPLYANTNEINNDFYLSVGDSFIDISGDIFKIKVSYENLLKNETNDLSYGSTIYNENIKILDNEINNGTEPIGYLHFEYNTNPTNFFLSGYNFSNNITITINNQNLTTETNTITYEINVPEFVNLNFGNSNYGNKTIGTNTNTNNYNLGNLSLEEVNQLNYNIPVFLSTNTSRSIKIKGLSTITTTSDNIQHIGITNYKPIIGEEENIAYGNTSNKITIWNEGINEGITKTGDIKIKPFQEIQETIKAGLSNTTFDFLIIIE